LMHLAYIILSKQIPIFPVCEESLANDFSPR
jgi:hypothetical protein